jgi:hypothetical protein
MPQASRDLPDHWRWSPLTGWVVLIALVLRSGFAQADEYQFYAGKEGSAVPVPDGTVWLYYYNWGGLQRFKLSDIREGRAKLELDARRLREEVKPARNTHAFLVVLEVAEGCWYRTKDLQPKRLLKQWLPALEGLGKTHLLEGESVSRIVLPALEPRRFWLHSPEGKPLAHRSISAAVFVTRKNHCAVHQGLALGSLTTDADGWLEVRTQEVPLWLQLSHWTPSGDGIAGQMFSSEQGLRIKAGVHEVEVRTTLPLQTWEVRLLNGAGAPIAGVTLMHWMKVRGCGANYGAVGRTDEKGVVRVTLAPQALERLAFGERREDRREFSEEELRALLRDRRVTITWDRPPRLARWQMN